jgi:hypothetical protein
VTVFKVKQVEVTEGDYDRRTCFTNWFLGAVHNDVLEQG